MQTNMLRVRARVRARGGEILDNLWAAVGVQGGKDINVQINMSRCCVRQVAGDVIDRCNINECFSSGQW